MDLLDLLPEKELETIERAAYDMLHKHGYPVKGARKDGRVRRRLKNALQRRGHELVIRAPKGMNEACTSSHSFSEALTAHWLTARRRFASFSTE